MVVQNEKKSRYQYGSNIRMPFLKQFPIEILHNIIYDQWTKSKKKSDKYSAIRYSHPCLELQNARENYNWASMKK